MESGSGSSGSWPESFKLPSMTKSEEELLDSIPHQPVQPSMEQNPSVSQVPRDDINQNPHVEEVADLKLKVKLFLATFSERSPRADVITKIIHSLDLDEADEAKLLKLSQVIDNLNEPEIRQSLKTPKKAGEELVKIMQGWDDVHKD